MQEVRLINIGNSVGFILPKNVLAKLGLESGDTAYLTQAPDGCRLTPYNPDFHAQMKVAEDVMKRRRDALRELAK